MSPAELVDELVRRGQVTHAVVADIASSAEHAGKSIERGLIVMDDGELIGILTPLDLMIRTNAFCEAS